MFDRPIRLSNNRENHIFTTHPEMNGQMGKVEETLQKPDKIVRSNSDFKVELYYKNYFKTSVTNKFLCLAVKILQSDCFIITSYFTDSIKKGEILWPRK